MDELTWVYHEDGSVDYHNPTTLPLMYLTDFALYNVEVWGGRVVGGTLQGCSGRFFRVHLS